MKLALFCLIVVMPAVAGGTKEQKRREEAEADVMFESMLPVYVESGWPMDELISRKDIWLENYEKFKEMGRVNGNSYQAKLNSVELLSKDEFEVLFGLTPDDEGSSNSESESTSPKTAKELENEFGEQVISEAFRILMSLRQYLQEYDLSPEKWAEYFENFVEDYAKIADDIEGETVEERINFAINSNDVIGLVNSNLNKDSENKRKVYINEIVDNMGSFIPPENSAYGFEKIADSDSNMGFILTSDHYNQQRLTSCDKLKGKPDRCGTRRCKTTGGIPDCFNDWEEMGYVTSILPYRAPTTMPGGWAIAASQVMDMYQQIYAKNVTLYRKDLVSFEHLLGCVYKSSGLARGSPVAAFQYMSDHVNVPRQNQTYGINCRPDSHSSCYENYVRHSDTYFHHYLAMVLDTSGKFYKYVYLWDKARKTSHDRNCTNPDMFNRENSATPNVTFLHGKAYTLFADAEPQKVQDEDLNDVELVEVYGENIAKPLLYKKGPLAVLMQTCYEIFFEIDGIFDTDCSKSTQKYLPQWVIILSYGPTWFGTVLPKDEVLKSHFVSYAEVTRVSRKKQYMMNWNSFIIPRVQPYSNTESCSEHGVSTSHGCRCDAGYFGRKCQHLCKASCKNGGRQATDGSCRCDCPNTHTGRYCGKVCNCGVHGKCDENGNCICQNQLAWGPRCENSCSCKNGGYCHKDGTCECLAGYAGTTCEDECTLDCAHPKRCRYSNQVTESGAKMGSFCDCLNGFYGEKCDNKVYCQAEDQYSAVDCQVFQSRDRCFQDEAMENCPHRCGHCHWLNQVTDTDS